MTLRLLYNFINQSILYLYAVNHKMYMQRCLDLAKLGLKNAAPNPSVGAVLVHENKIIGEGYTSTYGGNHAEVNCIESVDEQNKQYISKSTLYVSLEPCSHFGKTPPCSDLIIKNNIPKVVIACTDPNPLVAGKGIQKLKDAGIEVIEDVLKQEALFVNRRFFTFHTQKRPYIILKWAETKQGFFSPNNEEQFWITSKETKALVHSWRSEEMGILVGAKTVLVDNPILNTRLVEGKSPTRIIINTKNQLPKNLNIFDGLTPTIVFNYHVESEEKNIKHIKIEQDKDLINQVLNYLYLLNINSILVEGGIKTLESFIAKNYWDEARILIGNNELDKGKLAPKIKGKLIETYQISKDTIKHYVNA